MRILHTGDLHFGASLGGFSLLAEQEELAGTLLSLVERERIGAVLLTGDLLARTAAPAEAVSLYDRFLTALCGKCPVYLLTGGDGSAARLASLSGLLRGAGLYVQGSLRERPQPVRQADVEFWMLPHVRTTQVRALYPEADIRGNSGAMRVLMDDIRARRDPSAVTVVAAHCLVEGTVLCESDMPEGGARVSPLVFKGMDYVALGQLHRAQQPAENIRYAGAPYPYSFSECAKTVTVFDTESRGITALPVRTSRTLRAVRGRFADILAQQPSEDYLKIELTDRDAGLETRNTLRARFPHLVTLLGQRGETAEASRLPVDLLARFCEEIGGTPAEQAHTDLFLTLLREAREGGAGA